VVASTAVGARRSTRAMERGFGVTRERARGARLARGGAARRVQALEEAGAGSREALRGVVGASARPRGGFCGRVAVMRVLRLTLKDIGPFGEAEIEIPPPVEGQRGELVIFEGPNGCGKTTIAQVLACAAAPERGLLDSPLHPPHKELGRRRRSEKIEVTTTIEEKNDTLLVHGPDPWSKWLPQTNDLLVRPRILACGDVASGESGVSLAWAAFTYQGHLATPVIATKGPTEIESPPLKGALSFGAVEPSSSYFGQLLINLDYEIAKASRSTEHQKLAASRQSMLDKIATALSQALGRDVRFEFPFGQHAPTILIDNDPIPIDLLGEGMRSTFAWLSDLLVRLHRIPWENQDLSPLEQDFWLILDEIDESLHPTAQMRILPTLRGLFPNARIYITTHSPFVVASAGEGYVFSIRSDKQRRVNGRIEPRKLERGQSLEWVVEEIFDAQTGIIDPFTQSALRDHRADIARLRRRETFGESDWQIFLDRRSNLLSLTEEVRAVVAMQEVPVQDRIDERLDAAAE